MRLKRRRLSLRAFRARRDLTQIVDRTNQIGPRDIRAFTTLRNEYERLPYFLAHYRALGVGHFFFVLNDCEDESEVYLKEQPDVSLWRSSSSYKASRFGVDWTMRLQNLYGHKAWCLTVDADELLIYPHWETRDLHAVTKRLEQTDSLALGAFLLDMFPKGALDQFQHTPGQDPIDLLNYFDAGPYRTQRQDPAQNLWMQGGTRDRAFFKDQPKRAPTLNKLPFVYWDKHYTYLNSTHSMLPPKLNHSWDGPVSMSGDDRLSGVLLHTKFLPNVVQKSKEEKQRKEHFGHPENFATYYDWLSNAPDLWHDGAKEFKGWQQLETLGLLSKGGWD
jgi:hypothetical protein